MAWPSALPWRFAMTAVAIALLMACATTPEAILIALPDISQADSPQPDISQPDIPQPDIPQPASSLPCARLVVRTLTVPEYMRSRRVRYRADPETIAQWTDAYWAERIEVGMTRAFAAALRARLPRWTICEAGCGDSTPTITLTLDLLRLDLVRRQHEVLTTAQFGLSSIAASTRPPAGPEPLLVLSTPVMTDSAQGEAQALSAMLERLADRAAALVERDSRPAQAVP